MKKMGGLQADAEACCPACQQAARTVEQVDDNALKKPEAIIRSMTPQERRNPGILNASRRKRIAAGSGTTVQDVNQLISQFEQAKNMMKTIHGPQADARENAHSPSGKITCSPLSTARRIPPAISRYNSLTNQNTRRNFRMSG